MMRWTRIAAAAAMGCLFVLGCDAEQAMGPEPRDNRAEIPPDDGVHHAFVGGDVVIEPGEDKMYCFHMVAEEDLALTDIEMLQGEYGHHAVLVSSTDPLPPGTIEDCSDDASSAKLTALVIPVDSPPQGAAFWIAKGTPIVLQSHYVNAGDDAMVVRDAVRARKIPESEVTTWMAPFTTTSLDFEIPADGSPTELVFDCAMDRDVDLLYVGGHMHEQGTSFEFALGPDVDSLERIYNVDKWIPEFRDLPPVELYSDNPLRLTQGTVLRTTCRWENRTGETLGFPEEMCVAFGVMAGTREQYDCRTQ